MARKTKAKKRAAARAKATAYRRVKSLLKFLKAYGRGADAGELREKFATRCGTKLVYLTQLAYGYRSASATMAADIERHTHGIVKAEELRPDINWSYLRQTTTRLNPAAPLADAVG